MNDFPACECERAAGICLCRLGTNDPSVIAASVPTCSREIDSKQRDAASEVRRFEELLAATNRPGLRRVQIAYEGDAIILRGFVRSFYEKLLAVEICRREAAGLRIVDGIVVVDDRRPPQS